MKQPVSTALGRKLSAGREEQGEKPRSVLRALRLAFARTAGDRFQLALSVIGAKQSRKSSGAVTETLGSEWLLLQFVNPDGLSAAICLDVGTVSAIVQVQTIGEVLPGSPPARPYTDTDAAMVAPLVEEAMLRAVDLVDDTADQASLSGYEFRARLGDIRSLSLAMIEDAYRVYYLTVELGGGIRQGLVALLLPECPAEQGADDTSQTDTGPNLEQASGVVRAELNAVISRMSLPLATLSGLSAGDVLPLTGSRLDRAEVLTIDRARAAFGRLGQCGGMRAVRLNEYATVAALEQTDMSEFLEARSKASVPSVLDEAAQPDISRDAASLNYEETHDGLGFDNPDQMVAEISQLAGLTDLDNKPGKP